MGGGAYAGSTIGLGYAGYANAALPIGNSPMWRYIMRTADNIHQASLCTRPMPEQIWVLMQAKYHLLAEA